MINRFLALFLIALFSYSSYSVAQYITNCGTNSYGNEYCSYSDGSYEYRNQPGNEYYDRQGSYYHSDEYEKSQEEYYRREEENRQKEQAEYEYQEYKRQQQEESRKPTIEEMYGTPSFEEMYGPMYDGHTTETKSYSSSYYTCPSNSTLRDGECYCNDGYFVGAGGYCVQDMQYTCSQKYPGTIYRASDKSCICPTGNPFSWDATTRSCPKTNHTYPLDNKKNESTSTLGLSNISFDWGAFVFFGIIVSIAVVILRNIGEKD